VALAEGQVLEANLALRGSVPDSFGAQLSPNGTRPARPRVVYVTEQKFVVVALP
jgi:hypothetical protein